jgi:hypothetical protein
MDLELATMQDIVLELNKRVNCPFILIFHDIELGVQSVAWSESVMPSALDVMQELTLVQAQFLRFLQFKLGEGSDGGE